jgi:hypothetical protein
MSSWDLGSIWSESCLAAAPGGLGLAVLLAGVGWRCPGMPIRGQPVVRESMMQSFLGLGAATATAQSGISLPQMPSNSSSNPFNWFFTLSNRTVRLSCILPQPTNHLLYLPVGNNSCCSSCLPLHPDLPVHAARQPARRCPAAITHVCSLLAQCVNPI